MTIRKSSKARLKTWGASINNRRRTANLNAQVGRHARHDANLGPVVMFNASARLTGLSLNAAFSLLTSWSLRLAGVPLIQFICHSGMSHCVLGTNRQDYTKPPPCQACITQSKRLYAGADVVWFEYHEYPLLLNEIENLDIEKLSNFGFHLPKPVNQSEETLIPLGKLVLPSTRWALRRHNLLDDDSTRYLMRAYMLSAYTIAVQFANLLLEKQPHAVVIFNGILYPEATALWVANKLGIRTVTHEVGFYHLSTFFSPDQATAYRIDIPDTFELSPTQSKRLDSYLENRFQGKFTMAGIRFWPEMHSLDQTFLDKARKFSQIVPVFTNVAYDTSQIHANVIFPNMFAWLEMVMEIAWNHPDTLFVIRAHPDEIRVGTAKLSNESVQDWVIKNKVDKLPNVAFISPTDYISSYELIQRAKFVLVYNSSIGLEAALFGKAVVCAGNARYTQHSTVYFPQSPSAWREQVIELMEVDHVDVPAEFQRNARRFLYYQLFRVSLPMGEYLETVPRQGFVQLKSFSWQQLLPGNSTTMRVIVDGILKDEPFVMPEYQELQVG